MSAAAARSLSYCPRKPHGTAICPGWNAIKRGFTCPDCGKKMLVDATSDYFRTETRAKRKCEGITCQLGCMKERLSDLRKNDYAHSPGEKYTVTRGRDMKNLLSGELALMAAPATTPLFLRKYHAKGYDPNLSCPVQICKNAVTRTEKSRAYLTPIHTRNSRYLPAHGCKF